MRKFFGGVVRRKVPGGLEGSVSRDEWDRQTRPSHQVRQAKTEGRLRSDRGATRRGADVKRRCREPACRQPGK